MKNKESNEQQWKWLVSTLRENAESKGITQQEIANRTGMLRTNINRIFTLKYSPNLDTFVKIANAIEVKLVLENKEAAEK